RSPFSTSTLALGGWEGSFGYFARQFANLGLAVSWKLASLVPLAPLAATTETAATAITAATTAMSGLLRVVVRDMGTPFRWSTRPRPRLRPDGVYSREKRNCRQRE